MSISLSDLILAYRKAKVDLFYSSRACREALSEFEADLCKNLKYLAKGINKAIKNGQSVAFSKVLMAREKDKEKKTWTLVPKEIIPNKPPEHALGLINSDPQHLWNITSNRAGNKGVQIEFRLMENLPVEYHVLSALWINKVGHKFEERLTESARGNRLRRKMDGALNLLSLGSMVPYLYPYCKWRDDAFSAMEAALEQGKSVAAITADVKSFYHCLDVDFMLDNTFMKKIGVKLKNGTEMALHRLFINELSSWAKSTPIGRGLPVGLAASSVIANLALFELDEIIEEEVVPLYYGRYVDDIILVIENSPRFSSAKDVWEWLVERSRGALTYDHKKEEVKYQQYYLKGSTIVFGKKKGKTFLLSGGEGRSILRTIQHEIRMRTSEWRALPSLPEDDAKIEPILIAAIQQDGIPADSLRRADRISVRRADFALKLRDIEAYMRALPPHAWEKHRHAFLSAIIRRVLVLPTFFDFFNYLPRLLMLAASCGDFEILRQMIDALEKIVEQMRSDVCTCHIKAAGKSNNAGVKPVDIFADNLRHIIRESIASAFPLPGANTESTIKKWKEFFGRGYSQKDKASKTTLYNPPKEIQDIQKQHLCFMSQDLAYRPLKINLLPMYLSSASFCLVDLKDLPRVEIKDWKNIKGGGKIFRAHKAIDDQLGLMENAKEASFLPGILFPTRPLNIHELYFLYDKPFPKSKSDRSKIKDCLLGLRGFGPKNLPYNNKGVIDIPCNFKARDKVLISVTAWKTDEKSWKSSVVGNYDLDPSRLARLTRLLNAIIGSSKLPDYVILPELSVPPSWFLAIAGKLQRRGISLICGVEYLHPSRFHPKRIRSGSCDSNSVYNQVWVALLHDALGFPATIIYRQDKQNPALHEEDALYRIGGKTLNQENPWESPPILDHNGFRFAILICSELTNIAYRSALRGKLDALFVPEWNQDTESFGVLIESAALDIHAYIIQCNNREYGDSRIRAPYRDSWKRDIVRTKGGIEDYFVTGEIDIKSLRVFQSDYRSPEGPFKPVPDGFKIVDERRISPKGGK